MKSYLLLFLITISASPILGQTNDPWTAFWNNDTTLIGFKDKKGTVKIAPRFNGFTTAGTFENIIAVTEENNGEWKSYYLTKSGKVVGRDSLHIFDNTADCESEGFIRFRDSKTDKVGMFDRNGNTVIPAIYNDLSRVRNGLIVGLKGAEKKYWDKDKHTGCNHYSWTGGEELLIDTLHHVLVEHFSCPAPLNLFTLQKTGTRSTDTTRVSFPAKDGSYYSFVDFEKEFRQWITSELRNGLTKEKLTAIAFDTITWEAPEGWAKTSKEKFIIDNFAVLKNGLSEILQPKTNYAVFNQGLNQFMFEGAAFEKYYNNCGESKDWIYPVMSIVISYGNTDDVRQSHYEFLRTDNGYRLLCVAAGNTIK